MTAETWINFFKSVDPVIPIILIIGPLLAYFFIWHLGVLDHWIDADIDAIAKEGNKKRAIKHRADILRRLEQQRDRELAAHHHKYRFPVEKKKQMIIRNKEGEVIDASKYKDVY